MRVNGSAVYGTRPWSVAEATTTEDTAVRFTQCDGAVNAILLDLPEREFGLRGVDATDVDNVRVLGLDEPVEWRLSGSMLTVRLP